LQLRWLPRSSSFAEPGGDPAAGFAVWCCSALPFGTAALTTAVDRPKHRAVTASVISSVLVALPRGERSPTFRTVRQGSVDRYLRQGD